jgi:hypothetical protein
MTVTTGSLTGVFTADRVHSSLQFAIRHMQVSSFRASFGAPTSPRSRIRSVSSGRGSSCAGSSTGATGG